MAAAKGNGQELEFIYFSFPLSVIVADKIDFHTQVNENINWLNTIKSSLIKKWVI